MTARPVRHNNKADRHAAANKGFTLLEFMVSVALLTVIITVISGAIRFSYRSVDLGERKVESLGRQRTSLAIIDSQIQSALPLAREEQGVKVPYFKGERDVLVFASNYSLWDGERGFVQVTYRVVQNEKGKRALYAGETTIGGGNLRETKLLEGFDEIYFEYFLRDPITQEPAWTGLWRDSTVIPGRIAVHLSSAGTKHKLIIPMRTGGGGIATQVKPRFM